VAATRCTVAAGRQRFPLHDTAEKSPSADSSEMTAPSTRIRQEIPPDPPAALTE